MLTLGIVRKFQAQNQEFTSIYVAPHLFLAFAIYVLASYPAAAAAEMPLNQKPGVIAKGEIAPPVSPDVKQDIEMEDEIIGDATPGEYGIAVENAPDPYAPADKSGYSALENRPKLKVEELSNDPEVEAKDAMDAAEKELERYDKEFPPMSEVIRNVPRWVYSPLPSVPAGETTPEMSANPQSEAARVDAVADSELAEDHEALKPLAEDELHPPSPFIEKDYHREKDCLDDSESFNDQVKELNRQLNERWQEFDKQLKNRLGDQEKLVQEMQRGWRQKRVDAPFYRLPDADLAEKTYADDQYLSDRSRLDLKRMDEWDQYQANRTNLQHRMLNYDRASDEYLRLEKTLNDLDRRQAAKERDYERDYRNLDVDYSLGRW